MKIYFVTSNNGKFTEAREVVGSQVVKKALAIEEIQSIDVSKVIEHKLDEAYSKLKKPVIVEDTGLYLKALRGFPGALIKHLETSIGVKNIPRLLSFYGSMEAKSETAVGFRDRRTRKVFISTTVGRIADRPRGKNGFGFDPIFVPEGSRKTYAEMGVGEKNRFSARAKSFRKLHSYLKKNGY